MTLLCIPRPAQSLSVGSCHAAEMMVGMHTSNEPTVDRLHTCSVACSASRVLLLPVLPITLICRPNWFTAGGEASHMNRPSLTERQ